MTSDDAVKLARALAAAVRPERKAPRSRLGKWWAKRRLAEDEAARWHLTTELAKLVQALSVPDEWMPEAVGRRALLAVLRTVWELGDAGQKARVHDLRATILVDSVTGTGHFTANVAVGGETLRLMTGFSCYDFAVAGAEAWCARVGFVPTVQTLSRGSYVTDADAERVGREAEATAERVAAADEIDPGSPDEIGGASV